MSKTRKAAERRTALGCSGYLIKVDYEDYGSIEVFIPEEDSVTEAISVALGVTEDDYGTSPAEVGDLSAEWLENASLPMEDRTHAARYVKGAGEKFFERRD